MIYKFTAQGYSEAYGMHAQSVVLDKAPKALKWKMRDGINDDGIETSVWAYYMKDDPLSIHTAPTHTFHATMQGGDLNVNGRSVPTHSNITIEVTFCAGEYNARKETTIRSVYGNIEDANLAVHKHYADFQNILKQGA